MFPKIAHLAARQIEENVPDITPKCSKCASSNNPQIVFFAVRVKRELLILGVFFRRFCDITKFLKLEVSYLGTYDAYRSDLFRKLLAGLYWKILPKKEVFGCLPFFSEGVMKTHSSKLFFQYFHPPKYYRHSTADGVVQSVR